MPSYWTENAQANTSGRSQQRNNSFPYRVDTPSNINYRFNPDNNSARSSEFRKQTPEYSSKIYTPRTSSPIPSSTRWKNSTTINDTTTDLNNISSISLTTVQQSQNQKANLPYPTKKCPLCRIEKPNINTAHSLQNCYLFQRSNPDEKMKFITTNDICIFCLNPGHSITNCKNIRAQELHNRNSLNSTDYIKYTPHIQGAA